jgi:hypothetical protein
MAALDAAGLHPKIVPKYEGMGREAESRFGGGGPAVQQSYVPVQAATGHAPHRPVAAYLRHRCAPHLDEPRDDENHIRWGIVSRRIPHNGLDEADHASQYFFVC